MKITVYGHTSHTARLAEIALFVRQLGASQLHTEIWSGFYDYLRQYSALPANMVCFSVTMFRRPIPTWC